MYLHRGFCFKTFLVHIAAFTVVPQAFSVQPSAFSITTH